MVRAACHCGAVRLVIEPDPAWVNDCNCSLCRRYGALWAYMRDVRGRRDLTASLVQGDGDLEAYVWGEREYGLNRCKACGCVTHITRLETGAIMAVNARMLVGIDPAELTLYRWDNAYTGRFWTREDRPIVPGVHPPMPPTSPDDWR